MDKSDFYTNQNMNLYLNIGNQYLEKYEMNLSIYNSYGNIISKISEFELLDSNLYQCNFNLNSAGKYYAEASINIGNENFIKSSKLIIDVSDLNKEIQDISLNKDNLKDISLRTNGQYYDINQLSD